MPAFEQFPLGTIRKKLEAVGFRDVEVQDLSRNVASMMRFFFLLACVPYLIILFLGVEAHFVNAMTAVSFGVTATMYIVRFLMVKARKPLVNLSSLYQLR